MPANHREKTGYCNPPQHSRFKKGQSGNPKGRPKGRPNLATVLENTLREKVVVQENGRRKTITKFEAGAQATRQPGNLRKPAGRAPTGHARVLRRRAFP